MVHEHCVIREGALSVAPGEYRKIWGNRTPLLIADHNTWKVAGKSLRDMFLKDGFVEVPVYIFADEGMVYADDRHVAEVRSQIEGKDVVPVAIGSGTLNDLVKRASFECGKDYMVVATAPSVDGYTATGAAITVDGFKITLDCPPPALVIADTASLREAPYPMIASGYGDLAAKITAGADWLIADQLGIEPIVPSVWDMVQRPLRSQLSDPKGLAARESAVIDGLFLGLVQVGYAMQRYKDSRPASGADHLMSHVWEMDHLCVDGVAVSHGFKVAIGTLCSTAMMTELLGMSAAGIEQAYAGKPGMDWDGRLEEIKGLLEGDASTESTLKACRIKFQDAGKLVERRKAIVGSWETIKARIRQQIIPFNQLQMMFKVAGCPCQPAEIGLTRAELARGMYKAQLIRKRYTVLDLAYETGLMDHLVGVVAYGDGYFNRFLSA